MVLMEKIYLDHAAAMPIDSRAFEFAKSYLLESGNPSSLYEFGQKSKEAIEEARRKIADLINAESEKTIIFTGSATESNNLAIRGVALRNQNVGKEVLCSAIEHISVINPMKDLQKNGWIFNKISVDEYGLIDQEELEKLLSKNTILTSIMYGNNEIGTIQQINEISKIVHNNGKYLHCDATAAAGRIATDPG